MITVCPSILAPTLPWKSSFQTIARHKLLSVTTSSTLLSKSKYTMTKMKTFWNSIFRKIINSWSTSKIVLVHPKNKIINSCFRSSYQLRVMISSKLKSSRKMSHYSWSKSTLTSSSSKIPYLINFSLLLMSLSILPQTK